MARKGENIYKRKDGRWEGRYALEKGRQNKARYGYVYARSYQECREKLLAAKLAVVQKEKQTVRDKSRTTLGCVASQWLDMKSAQLKESTLAKYDFAIREYIAPYLGEIALQNLCRQDMEDYVQILLTRGGKSGGLSPKTVTDTLSLLRNILSYGKTLAYPCSGDICDIHIRQEPKPLSVLTREEQRILSDYLMASKDSRDLGILISLYTGMRIGEICALAWENISLEHKHVVVDKALQRIQDSGRSRAEQKTRIVIDSPKSVCSIRTIPLPEIIVNVLSCHRQESGFLLTGRSDKFVEPRSMQNHFKTVLKKCGIRETHYHTLRHTFATRCIELEFDVKTLSEILGHASVNITMNRYVHPSMELKRENMQKLCGLFAVT